MMAGRIDVKMKYEPIELTESVGGVIGARRE